MIFGRGGSPTDENLTVLTAEILRLAKIKKITEYNEKGEDDVLYEEA